MYCKKDNRTYQKERFILRAPIPLYCKMSLDFNYGHNLCNADTLMMKRISEEVLKK